MAKFKYQVDKRTKKQPTVALSTFLPRLTKVIHNMLKVTGNPQHLPPPFLRYKTGNHRNRYLCIYPNCEEQ